VEGITDRRSPDRPALGTKTGQFRFSVTEATMAVNKPTGDNARKGAVKKRSQLATKTMGKKTWTKRDKTTGEFMDQKKAPAKKKFKGVRRER
jgi:hypothetical protein